MRYAIGYRSACRGEAQTAGDAVVPAALRQPRGCDPVAEAIHAWTGFWGALAFLLIGTSGMLLNHRSTLKIDTGAPNEVMEANIAVDPALIKSPDDLGRWAQAEFGIVARTARATGRGRRRRRRARAVDGQGCEGGCRLETGVQRRKRRPDG